MDANENNDQEKMTETNTKTEQDTIAEQDFVPETDSEVETKTDSEQVEMLAVKVEAKDGLEKVINDMLKNTLDKKYFDAVLIPHIVPTGDSYMYLLIQDSNVLATASPFAPIMPTQGARALSNVTHLGTDGLKLAAVMRPCETRAAIELSKLDQSILDDVTLISFDCPGVLATRVFIEDPKKGLEMFNQCMNEGSTDAMRPMCQVCDKANNAYGDLHIGRIGVADGSTLIIQKTQKGKALLAALGMKPEESIDAWQKKTEEMTHAMQNTRKEAIEELKKEKLGLDNLLDTFSSCLKCHNCMRVCPIDYCQQCYFESDDMKQLPGEYFSRAATKGSVRFPVDTLQYHLGRMLHMSMSCVSCGTCEDACPMSIPVAQVYGSVACDVQKLFDYHPGSDPNEPRPLATYEAEEFSELEN
jgi:formate dehydrogenase subunit beta